MVGSVSPVGRVAGLFAVAAALCGLVAPAFPLVVERGGPGVGAAANGWDFLPPLAGAVVLGVAGVLCVRGVLPRLGLAAVGTVGAASVGLLAQTLFRYDTGQRSGRDLPLPVAMVRGFRYDAATGLHLQLAASVLAVTALALVLFAWPRTWMEDDGSFEGLRPLFGGLGLFAGFLAAAGVCLAVGDSAVASVGPQSLLNRTGLDGWGTGGLALVLLLGGVVAASLRPRLSAVGAYAALAAMTANQALAGGLLVARSTVLRPAVGGVTLVLAAFAFTGLAVGAWRMSREPGPDDNPV